MERWADRVRRSSSSLPFEEQNPRKRVSMSFVSTAGKKQSKSRVVRVQLASRLKTAISLIVVRGASCNKSADGGERNVKILMNDQEAREKGDKWILPGAFPSSFFAFWWVSMKAST